MTDGDFVPYRPALTRATVLATDSIVVEPTRRGVLVDEDGWESARLIPVSGINGADEQERRGVSGLLAVLESVREFGRAVLCPLGAPAGTISTYIEVPFS